jgi:urea transport system substrate-binding protein
MKNLSRREFMSLGGAAALAGLSTAGSLLPEVASAAEPIKLGLLHSLTGTIAIAEAAMVDAEKMAIDEINASGGVLGRPIQPVIQDGASQPSVFAEKASLLLAEDKVAAIVGCYTSASRKAVLPILARNKGLLYYPTYFEGQEEDPHVMYTSQSANQSVVQAVNWLVKEKGKTIFLVGSDYVYPHTCNLIAKATMKKNGGQLVGEEYAPLGQTDFSAIINKIKAAKPACIYSTVVGGSNVAFFKQLNAAGLGGSKITLLSTVVSENEIEGIGAQNAVGYYACMGYFQSIDSPANKKFVADFKKRYGAKRVIGDPMECAYNSVYLWKKGVEKAKSFDPRAVVVASRNLVLQAPEGEVKVDPMNNYVWKKVRIGRARMDGQFDVVWQSPGLVEPVPFIKV